MKSGNLGLFQAAAELPDYEEPSADDRCPICGETLVFVDCFVCGGEKYDPMGGKCMECGGDGGSYKCPNAPNCKDVYEMMKQQWAAEPPPPPVIEDPPLI